MKFARFLPEISTIFPALQKIMTTQAARFWVIDSSNAFIQQLVECLRPLKRIGEFTASLDKHCFSHFRTNYISESLTPTLCLPS